MPDYDFFTQPADIVSQILNFGLPSPIDVQVTGPAKNDKADYAVAQEAAQPHSQRARRGRCPHPAGHAAIPTFFVKVDRTRANQIGLSQRDVANDLLISLSSSSQTTPNYWLNPINGVNYSVAVQTPQYKIDSLDALKQSPISAGKLARAATARKPRADLTLRHRGGDFPLFRRAGLRRLRQCAGPRS